MSTVKLVAPIGIPAGTVVGSDGVSYPIVSGTVTLPANAAGALLAAGFYSASASSGTTPAWST